MEGMESKKEAAPSYQPSRGRRPVQGDEHSRSTQFNAAATPLLIINLARCAVIINETGRVPIAAAASAKFQYTTTVL
jgi:hypothetical protein